jgi:hypothetical protein
MHSWSLKNHLAWIWVSLGGEEPNNQSFIPNPLKKSKHSTARHFFNANKSRMGIQILTFSTASAHRLSYRNLCFMVLFFSFSWEFSKSLYILYLHNIILSFFYLLIFQWKFIWLIIMHVGVETNVTAF